MINLNHLTLSWRRPLSYRNQSIDLLGKICSASVMKELSRLIVCNCDKSDGKINFRETIRNSVFPRSFIALTIAKQIIQIVVQLRRPQLFLVFLTLTSCFLMINRHDHCMFKTLRRNHLLSLSSPGSHKTHKVFLLRKSSDLSFKPFYNHLEMWWTSVRG